MRLPIHLARDAHGDPRAVASPPYGLLALYLESELQDSPGTAGELLDVIAEIIAKRRTRWREVGNATVLSVSRAGARIVMTVGEADAELRLPLADFRVAVEAWLAFLTENDETSAL